VCPEYQPIQRLAAVSTLQHIGEELHFIAVFDNITGRKRTEEALRETNEYLDNLFNYANAPIIVWDPQFRITRFNRAFESLTGRNAADVIGESLEILFPPALVASSMELIRKMLAGERWETVEIDILHLDGSVRTVLWNSATLFAADGTTLIATIAQGQDITDRKRAEKALRESEERYRALAYCANDAIVTGDSAGIIVGWNRGAEKMFGYTQAEVIGQPVVLLMPPRFRKSHLDGMKWVEAGGEPRVIGRTVEVEGLHKDGSELSLELSLAQWEIALGRFYTAIIRDITQRKRSDETLRENAARLQTLFEYSPISIWEEDLSEVQAHFDHLRASGVTDFRAHFEGHPEDVARCAALVKVLDVNQTSVRLFEARSKDEMSTSLLSFFTAASLAVLKEELIVLAEGGTRFESEAPIRTLAGGERTVFLSLKVVPGCERTLTHVLISFTDVTERKQLEAQFRQAQKMEAVGQLAGGVAHDFNNILTVISASCDFLDEGLHGSEPLLNDVRAIREASESAAKLTRQLLAFSRRQVLEPRVLDPNALLRDSENMLTRLLGEDVAIRLELAPAAGFVRADPGQLEQVIVNLAVNARDAMPDGGTLTLATAGAALDEGFVRKHVGASVGPFVMLAVTDTGCGMDEATLAKVFEPFFTTKEKGKGTGLGLSTVYGIVKQSGGFIWVNSEPGQGTTFKIYLPLAAPDQQPWRPTISSDAARQGGDETILLVEDNESVRALAARVLRNLGYRVLEADGLEEARQTAASEETIHLLLTDVVMPGGSGRDVSAAVRASHSAAKVLYMSGYTDNAIVHHGVLDSSVAFLQKPFTPDSLGRRVREVLDRECAAT
jgi:PAS domain S-box-containing protein